MINFRREILSFLLIVFLILSATSQNKKSSVTESDVKIEKKSKKNKKKKYKLPDIDLNHWKVTVPVNKDNGKPLEVSPPEILNYATNEALKPYMYNDSTRAGGLVFYACPTNSTTANTKYSRSELREQMVPGDNSVNWTFAQGGIMKGKLAVKDVSRDANGKYHKVIIMQIHGRLTNEQRDLIGAKDNNAPPMLKIYWQNGKIRVKTKVLKYTGLSGNALLQEEVWGNDDGFTFDQEVGTGKFSLEVKVSDGKMVVILNNTDYKVYENIHLKKWGIFENYFKAGNYFRSRDEGSFARVTYYELSVSH